MSHRAIIETAPLFSPQIWFVSAFNPNEEIHIFRAATDLNSARRWIEKMEEMLKGRVVKSEIIESS